MQYILCFFIIGQLAIHHLYTACFLCAIITCSIFIKHQRWPLTLLCIISCILGGAIEHHFINKNQSFIQSNSQTSQLPTKIRIKFISLPIIDRTGLHATVATSNNKKMILKVYNPPKQTVPSARFFFTHTCKIQGKIKPANNMGQVDYFNVQTITFQSCYRSQPLWDDYIRYFRNIYTERLLSSKLIGKDKIIALTTGNSQYITPNELSLIRQLGISHLFAVSGTHVGILLSLLYLILKRLPMPLAVVKIIILCLLPIYLIFAGDAPSAQRAVLMASIVLIFSKLLLLNGITILSLSYIALSLYAPELHYHLGFQFSFTICFFLILSQKWLSKQNLYLVLWKTTLVSFYGTLSISYHHFNEIQWQSIITNIVFVPLYSFIIIPFAFLTIPMYLISPHIIENISILPNTLFQFQEALLQMFQPLTKFHWVIANYGEPGFLIITFCSFISMLLLNLKKYRYFLIFTVIAIFFSIVFKPSFTDEMILIDVGQGDAILFKSRTHKTLLIDTGGQLPHLKQRSNFNITERKLYPTLKSKGITQIDYLLITHDHADHMGELKELADKVTIKNIIINPHHFNRDLLHEVIDITKSEQAILHSAFELKTLKLDEFQFQFLNATIKNSENPNEHSIITLANIYNNRILLMGDATVANEDLLRQKYNIPKINILKVGHHGSKTSTSENFLATIRPEIALISSGKNNMYRLPHPEILERLSKQDIATYNTAENQNLTIQFTSENYTLSKPP